MFATGDIIECFASTAGYDKYFLCVLECDGASAGVFLYINSDEGYAGDLVLDTSELPCLPKSPTGKSIISCAQPLRMNTRQLTLFKAKKLGTLPVAVAKKLAVFAADVKSLTREEKKWVAVTLAKIV